MAKKNEPKSVKISQFSIGKSTLNDILRSEEKFKKFKAEKEELGITGAAKTAKKVKGGYFDKLDGQRPLHLVSSGTREGLSSNWSNHVRKGL